MIRIIAIDDHKLFGDGLRAVFDRVPTMTMVNTYDNGLDIVEILENDRPDVVLLDISLPHVSGISLAETIKKRFSRIRVIMLSMLYDETFKQKLERLGVEGYLSKDIPSEQLIAVIHDVHAGAKRYLANTGMSQSTVQILKDDFQLTERETEIVELVRQGKTNQEIADILHRSLFTITTHRRNINQKLGAAIGRNPIQQLLDDNPDQDTSKNTDH